MLVGGNARHTFDFWRHVGDIDDSLLAAYVLQQLSITQRFNENSGEIFYSVSRYVESIPRRVP